MLTQYWLQLKQQIPLAGFDAGRWKIILDWEYDDQIFTHQKEFEIKNEDVVV